MTESIYFRPTIKQANSNLENFFSNKIDKYDQMRNFDKGLASPYEYVSGLSPYISHGIIKEKALLKKLYNSKSHSEKFQNEIFWRVYWKGWLESHIIIWKRYKEKLENFSFRTTFQEDNFFKAINAKTEIEAFNIWVKQLKSIGYLHNHTRMWFASIWIHYLNLPWYLGANFFLENLIDGDIASNTLSWRWVAGIQTFGKKYIANVNNINKYTFNSFPNMVLPKFIDNKIEKEEKIDNKINFYQKTTDKNTSALLILENNLNIDNFKQEYKQFKSIIVINFLKKLDYSPLVIEFKKKLSQDFINFLQKNNYIVQKINLPTEIEKLKLFIKKNNIEKLCTDYISVGYEKDIIEDCFKKMDLLYEENLDSFYKNSWDYSKKGYFQFKKNIPELMEKHIIN